MEDYILKVFYEEVLDELTLDTIRGGGICYCNNGATFTCSCYNTNGFNCTCNGESKFTCGDFVPGFSNGGGK